MISKFYSYNNYVKVNIRKGIINLKSSIVIPKVFSKFNISFHSFLNHLD